MDATGLMDSSPSEAGLPVMVFTEDADPVTQPHTFRFCPLGVQLYTRKKLSECSIMEFELDLPDQPGSPQRISCSGVVVNCVQTDNDSMYRAWIKFLDLPDSARDRIHCLTRASDLLCPFCENF